MPNTIYTPLSASKSSIAYPEKKQSIKAFALDLGIPDALLIEQFENAGIPKLTSEHLISEADKTALLEYLRAEHTTSKRTKIVELYQQHTFDKNQNLLVENVNDELLFLLAKNPNLMYSLGSRKFEELVAKLFSDRGHEVTLTKRTRDGGYDLLASVKNDFSSFIILAECKKYSPENKVGIEIVRGLYGVTEANRANQGLIITSSFFTKDAQEEQLRIGNRVGLKDYNDLVEWIKPYSNLGSKLD